jgi:hypothetical protein
MTRRITFLLLSVALAGVAWAKPKDDDEAYVRIARLSYIEGNVSYQHATDVDWAAASINLPLEPGDRIYTSSDGRAEIEFDDGSVYRLARNTDVEILSLRDDLIQLRILVGLSSLIVSSSTDFEIDTPAAAFNVLQKGSYRFQVEENGDTEAIVRKGKLEAANNDFSRRIQSGERIRVFPGNPANPEFARYERRDDWDEWNDRRNADLNAYGGRKYLPDTVYVGVSDLHRHGRWVEIEYYGSAWVPYSVGVYWSPYSVGRWCYRPLFGWTWVSYEPWGWLPYHYGRWYRSAAYGWCWLPGPAFSFNFWSPGLVAFYSGPTWISWCPLGPGDYYDVRHYHFNRGIYGHQLSQLARLHTRESGHLFNRDVPHAFRTVSLDRFRNGSFGSRDRDPDFTQVDQPWRRGELVRDSLSIRPTATSYRANPDRQAARPQGSRALPAVVRSNPAYNTRAQDHYTRITNPRIPSLPSRAERIQNDRESTPSTVTTRQAGRSLDTPRRERANSEFASPEKGRAAPDIQNSGSNRDAEQNGRRMTTPRVYRSTGSAGENPDDGGKFNRGTRSTTDAPRIRQSAPGEQSGQSASEQRQPARPAAEPRSNEENRQPAKPAEPRSRSAASPRSETSAITVTPGTDGARSYYYRGTTTMNESDSGARSYSSRAYSSPTQNRGDSLGATPTENAAPSSSRDTGMRSFTSRSNISPAYSAPSYPRSQGAGPASSGQSGQAYESRGSARSLFAPSPGRSSGNNSSFSGGISKGGSFSRSDSGSPKPQDRGSSGGGRGRR